MDRLVKNAENTLTSLEILDGLDDSARQRVDALQLRLENCRGKVARVQSLMEELSAKVEHRTKLARKYDVVRNKLLYMKHNFPRGIVAICEDSRDTSVSLSPQPLPASSSSPNSISVVRETSPSNDFLKVPQLRFGSEAAQTAAAPPSQAKSSPGSLPLPLVTDEEFSKISSYMRGRLTVNDVNEFLRVFNVTLEKKYGLIKKPGKAKSKQEKDQCLVWKEQEVGELAGKHLFCSAKDFDELSSVKIGNKKYLNIITILRHLKRMKEVRGLKAPKLTYYVACVGGD